MVPAAEAVRVGLAEFCVPDDQLDEVVAGLVATIAARPVEVVTASKAVVADLHPASSEAVRADGSPTVVHAVMQGALARYAR